MYTHRLQLFAVGDKPGRDLLQTIATHFISAACAFVGAEIRPFECDSFSSAASRSNRCFSGPLKPGMPNAGSSNSAFACEGGKQRSRRLRRQRNDMRTPNGKFCVIANSKAAEVVAFFHQYRRYTEKILTHTHRGPSSSH